jgi:hypothetical protein
LTKTRERVQALSSLVPPRSRGRCVRRGSGGGESGRRRGKRRNEYGFSLRRLRLRRKPRDCAGSLPDVRRRQLDCGFAGSLCRGGPAGVAASGDRAWCGLMSVRKEILIGPAQDWTCLCGQQYRVATLRGEIRFWPRNSNDGYSPQSLQWGFAACAAGTDFPSWDADDQRSRLSASWQLKCACQSAADHFAWLRTHANPGRSARAHVR